MITKRLVRTIRNPFVVLLFSVVVISGCTVSKNAAAGTESLPAPALKPFGRTILNSEQNLELISSASQVGFQFEGTECRLIASVPSWLDHNYLQ
ncbi:MAG TPA: hypothetical protein VFT06_05285, partial [Flavisolibacter sp.]|nr:hypothetical protein [Flavisolibacter sp.]